MMRETATAVLFAMTDDDIALTPDLLRAAYAAGVFPMADSRQGQDIGWYEPHLRGILPLDAFHVPRRLRRRIASHPYHVTFDRDFTGVMRGCAGDLGAGTAPRDGTWINDGIIDAYSRLHADGGAHSVEAWDGAGRLVGGVYGVSLGGAFFGESMFSLATDASKIALVFLAARLWRQGYALFDAQFSNPHLLQFGLIEIPQAEYMARLRAALRLPAGFYSSPPPSNEPGSSCKVGTAAEPPDTGDTGAMSAGAGVGVGAGAGCASACFSAGGAGLSAVAAVSGAASGVFSPEYASDAATVASFLHSITQTS